MTLCEVVEYKIYLRAKQHGLNSFVLPSFSLLLLNDTTWPGAPWSQILRESLRSYLDIQLSHVTILPLLPPLPPPLSSSDHHLNPQILPHPSLTQLLP